jgi:predicted NBD/HSP70 family sugar kinase
MKSYIASDLRDMNRHTIFQLLFEHDEVSKAELARQSGISMPTVIKIVDFLLEKGLVRETGERSTALGRKPVMLQLNKDAILAAGVILEGEYLRAGLVNLRRESGPVAVRHVGCSLPDGLGEALPEVIASLIAGAGVDPAHIRGIGIGVPGGYNPDTHEVNFAPLVDVNGPLSITRHERALETRFGAPVRVDNDANMAVLGEHQARKGESDLIYVSLGTGIGAGLVLDGNLRRGGTWQCGEIGYMTFTGDCVAGRGSPGWLESRVNLKALREKFGFEPFRPFDGDLTEVIDSVAEPVAICVGNIVSLLDLRTVVLGGVLTQALGSPFLAAVAARVKALCVLDASIEPQRCPEPGVVGAGSLALDGAIQEILSQDE